MSRHYITDKQFEHGGDLQSASQQYDISPESWLDLSTGISPIQYPNTDISATSLTRMPYLHKSFRDAVSTYYGEANFLATNGSQQIITALPRCLKKLPILLPDIGYKEHERAWAQHGAELIYYPALNAEKASNTIESLIETGKAFHLLVINPNNPTCCFISPDVLCRWASKLTKEAALIVDEAFADLNPSKSILASSISDNMIVLRSFGKFFGLPGLRLGFAFANEKRLHSLRSEIGIWDVNGPAQEIATRALSDTNWQNMTRIKLAEMANTNRQIWWTVFGQLKTQGDLIAEYHEALFSSYGLSREKAKQLTNHFARHGVLLRRIPVDKDQTFVRVGLLDVQNSQQVSRLANIIKSYLRKLS